MVVALSGLLCAAASGCGPSDGQIAFRWSIAQAVTGAPLNCLPGEIVDLQVDGVVNDFDCAAMAAVSDPLPAGTWTADFTLADASGTPESAVSILVTVIEGTVNDVGDIVFTVTM